MEQEIKKKKSSQTHSVQGTGCKRLLFDLADPPFGLPTRKSKPHPSRDSREDYLLFYSGNKVQQTFQVQMIFIPRPLPASPPQPANFTSHDIYAKITCYLLLHSGNKVQQTFQIQMIFIPRPLPASPPQPDLLASPLKFTYQIGYLRLSNDDYFFCPPFRLSTK